MRNKGREELGMTPDEYESAVSEACEDFGYEMDAEIQRLRAALGVIYENETMRVAGDRVCKTHHRSVRRCPSVCNVAIVMKALAPRTGGEEGKRE